MKVDVEGFEYEVLMGAKPLLEQNRITSLLIDFHGSILETRNIDVECLAHDAPCMWI
ncbi:MAG: FkbM family methyltransferase [Bacteroidia bacterium]|nr:FkbM family methyltransferase [Bacteroidia bacterium]